MTGAGRPGKVICLGINNVDLIYGLKLSELGPDTKIMTRAATTLIGGQCVNAAATLAGLGLDVAYVGTCGSDGNGDLVRRFLMERGIDASGCIVAEGMPNTTALIFVDEASGERCIVVTTPEGYPSHPGLADEALWRAGVYLYLDGNEIEAALRMAAEARRRGIPTLADVESLNERTRALIATVDTAIVPLGVGAALAGTADHLAMLEALRAAGPSRAAVTLGPDGAVGIDADGRIHRVPAVAVTAIDTTGAGDAFHAGFLFADVSGASFADALSFGALVAAEKCRVPGPSLPVPLLRSCRARFDATSIAS